METRRLPKYERETILLTSAADDSWEIYTFTTAMIRKLDQKVQEYPSLFEQKEENRELGYARYRVHKSCVSIHILSPQSDGRRKAASDYAKEHGFQKQQESDEKD